MKPQNKPVPLQQRSQKDTNARDDRRIAWRNIALRLAAILLIIVFLASECAPLLSGE
jgi:hypothetical protein